MTGWRNERNRKDRTIDEKKRSELLGSVFDSLTDEQKEKAKACKTEKELLDYLAEAGVELPDELLETVAGGIFKIAEPKKE